jgi:23S rRNA (guanosine2251-2'-O)-methyltransferase
MEQDLVVGIHSIAEAIKNPARTIIELVGTKEGIDELKKRQVRIDKIPSDKIQIVDSHKVQEIAKRWYQQLDYDFSRVPSGVFLVCTPVEQYEPTWLYDQLLKGEPISILALDQVTDVHNAAAIMRTSSFYGINCILISMKGNFGTGPNFSRIASGAVEHINVVRCSSLTKTLTKLVEMKVNVIGLSEHATDNELKVFKENSTCLVLGAEDEGMSNAVSRVVPQTIALKSQGDIKSLNVSVAAAVAMEKIFGC